MKLRKKVSRLLESNKPIDFMTLMRKTLRTVRLNESAEDDTLPTEEGLDELGGDDADVPEPEDGELDDLDTEGGDRSTVTITIPVDATLEEIMDAIDEAQAKGDEGGNLDAEAEDAVGDLEDEAEADAAADDEFGPEPDDEEEEGVTMEEDEEAFAASYSSAPYRKRASGTYDNSLTIKSNISPTPSMGKPAEYADGAPKRVRAQSTYNNNLTIKSKIQKDTPIFR